MKKITIGTAAFQSTKESVLFIDDLFSLYALYPKFERIFRILAENAFIYLQERLKHNVSSSADE